MKPGRKDIELGLGENESITLRLKMGDPLVSLISAPDEVQFIVGWAGGSLTKTTANASLAVNYTTGEVSWTPSSTELGEMAARTPVAYELKVLFAAGPIRRYLIGYIQVTDNG